MTDQIRKGQTLVIMVIATFIGIALLSLVISFSSNGFKLVTIARLIFYLFLVVALYRGYSWARRIIGILAIYSGVQGLMGATAIIEADQGFGSFLLVIGIAYIVSGVLLLVSKNVGFFLDFQKNRAPTSTT